MLRRRLAGPIVGRACPTHTPTPVLRLMGRVYGGGTGVGSRRGSGFGGGQMVASTTRESPQKHYAGDAAGVSALSTTPATTTRTFWAQHVEYTAPAEIKRRYAFERAADKRSRFHVRNRLREDGVVSNLYPLFLDAASGAEPSPLYVYETYVTRKAPPPLSVATPTTTQATPSRTTAAPGDGVVVKRVSPNRSWQAVHRSLVQRFTDLPPMVQVDYRVFAAGPLPAAAMQIPAAFHDLGWQTCELRLVGRYTYADLPAPQLQELVNKIVPWCIRNGGTGADAFAVVRERTGKLVWTSRGIASGGLRVFQGVLVQAIFVDDSAADKAGERGAAEAAASTVGAAGGPHASPLPPPPEPLGGPAQSLAMQPQGHIEGPLRFLVHSFVRTITYKGKKVESYYISDTSGKYLASYWEPVRAPQALEVGALYTATHARVKDYPSRGNLRLFEFTEGVTVVTADDAAGTRRALTEIARGGPQGTTGRVDSTDGGGGTATPTEAGPPHLPGRIGLRIDTKGTIASETSLYEDVKQHFGSGPYDEETQRRIADSVQGTPVVASFSLRQSIVRMLRFDANAVAQEMAALAAAGGHGHGGRGRAPAKQQPQQSDGGDTREGPPALASRHLSNRLLDPGLAPLLPYMDPNQPWAVLADYTALPLQVLHCCFDPSMRGWQDIAISTLSLMPERRVELLQRFRALLSTGLTAWGLRLAPQPWRTMAVSLLPAPLKEDGKMSAYATAAAHRRPGRAPQRHPPPSPFPTSLLVVGITGSRATAEEANRISLTVQQMSAYFKTNLVACVESEADAVRCMTEQLLTPSGVGPHSQRLRDPNSAMVIVTADRESRGARWVLAECLCRGVLPLLVGPARSPRRMGLICSSTRRQLLAKFETNPLKGVDLGRNIPVLAQQRVLVVGVDTCHTNVVSTGAVVGILYTPERNHLLPVFWRHEARGREVQHVADHFRSILARAVALYDGLDQVVILQDGDVFSELNAMKADIMAMVPRCGLTFMCLHKRTNIRFVHQTGPGGQGAGGDSGLAQHNNLVKGNVVPALTPVALDVEVAAPSFYLQTHESNMSTARTVVYTVHHVSPTLDIADVQQLANVMANVMAPQATKLPMSTRCAHKLADKAERLLDAVPELTCAAIPAPLNERLWFL